MPQAPRPTPSRLGLFGGTFDPVHIGHLLIAWEACQRLDLDRVLFIPCRQSPHKNAKTLATDQQRLEMLKESLRGQTWAGVSSLEITRPSPSYSIDTVEHFKARYPKARLFWILGSDQWATLPKWQRARELARLVEFIVFPRPTLPKAMKGWKKHDLDVRFDISATRIRSLFASGKCPAWVLPEPAFRSIKKHRLYRNT